MGCEVELFTAGLARVRIGHAWAILFRAGHTRTTGAGRCFCAAAVPLTMVPAERMFTARTAMMPAATAFTFRPAVVMLGAGLRFFLSAVVMFMVVPAAVVVPTVPEPAAMPAVRLARLAAHTGFQRSRQFSEQGGHGLLLFFRKAGKQAFDHFLPGCLHFFSFFAALFGNGNLGAALVVGVFSALDKALSFQFADDFAQRRGLNAQNIGKIFLAQGAPLFQHGKDMPLAAVSFMAVMVSAIARAAFGAAGFSFGGITVGGSALRGMVGMAAVLVMVVVPPMQHVQTMV